MDRFEIERFWGSDDSVVYAEFSSFTDEVQARIINRIEILERKSVNDLFRRGELEKLKGFELVLFELKLRITPPIRMLGILKGNRYRPFHIFVKRRDRLAPKDIRTALDRAKAYYQQ